MDQGREAAVRETAPARAGRQIGSGGNGAQAGAPDVAPAAAGGGARGKMPAAAPPDISAMTGRFGILGRILARAEMQALGQRDRGRLENASARAQHHLRWRVVGRQRHDGGAYQRGIERGKLVLRHQPFQHPRPGGRR